MAKGPEGKVIDKVHRKLHSQVYRLKLNMGTGAPRGVPDYYYEGDKSVMWVEYKAISLPWERKRAVPYNQISHLQLEWIKRSAANNVNVAIVFGDLDGKFVLLSHNDADKETPLEELTIYTATEIAEYIRRKTCQLKN